MIVKANKVLCMSVFDASHFKEHFPLFNQIENQQLCYLDNAATTQKPKAVIEAICQFYTHYNANAHRSSHRLARAATSVVEQTRQQAADYFNAKQTTDIIFCKGATEGLNLLAQTLGQTLQSGDEIILSQAEHHANLVPWQVAAQRHNLTLRFIPQHPNIPTYPDINRLPHLINERTRIISLTAGSNALGFRMPIESIQQHCQGKNILFIVDASQLAAHEEINVRQLACDFLVCSAHKFYGPSGIGILYGKTEHLNALPPWQTGGEMIKEVELYSSTFDETPHRFEPGTSSLSAIAGLSATFKFLNSYDRKAIQVHEQHLIHNLHEALKDIPELRLLSHAENNLGIASFTLDTKQVEGSNYDLGVWLDQHDIAVRVGKLCTNPLLQHLQEQSIVRASVAAYNLSSDVDHFVACIKTFLAVHSRKQTISIPQSFESLSNTYDDLNDLQLTDLYALKGWQARYRLLLKWSSKVHKKTAIRVDKNLVQGCESQAWLTHTYHNGEHQFVFDSDSRVVKGLGVLLLIVLREKPRCGLAELQAIFTELGLAKHLSQSRNNGFLALTQQALYLLTHNSPDN